MASRVEKARSLAGRFALALTAVLAVALVVELAARAIVPAPLPMLGRYDSGISYTPGFSCDRISLDSPPVRFRFEVDALGFRGKRLASAAKAPGTYRIFFLGASTTENAFFPEERTFPGLVEAALDEKLKGSPRIEVANAGVAGMTTARVLDTLVHRVLPLEPDLVVVLEGHNELCLALDPKWEPGRLGEPEPPPTFRSWLAGSSRVVALLDDWDLRRRMAVDKHGWYAKRARERHSKPFVAPPTDPLRGVPAFAADLHRVAVLCSDAGVPCVLMTQPSLYKDRLAPEEEAALITGAGTTPNLEARELKRALDAYNDAIRRVARDDGARVVDLAREVPADLEHFLDDVHFTARGNEAVAASVVRAILAEGALPHGAPPPRRP
jgi:lysophospholipase L1-like esterase